MAIEFGGRNHLRSEEVRRASDIWRELAWDNQSVKVDQASASRGRIDEDVLVAQVRVSKASRVQAAYGSRHHDARLQLREAIAELPWVKKLRSVLGRCEPLALFLTLANTEHLIVVARSVLEEEVLGEEGNDHAHPAIVFDGRSRPAQEVLQVVAAFLVENPVTVSAGDQVEPFSANLVELVTVEGNHISLVGGEKNVLQSAGSFLFVDKLHRGTVTGGQCDDLAHGVFSR